MIVEQEVIEEIAEKICMAREDQLKRALETTVVQMKEEDVVESTKAVLRLTWIDTMGRRCTSFTEAILPIPKSRWDTIKFSGARTREELGLVKEEQTA